MDITVALPGAKRGGAQRAARRAVAFELQGPEILATIGPDASVRAAHVVPELSETEISNVPLLSQHGTNTGRVHTRAHGMVHAEGGWPRDADPSEPEHVVRYKRKVEKEDSFLPAVRRLAHRLAAPLRQNGAIDIYTDFAFGPSSCDCSGVDRGCSDNANADYGNDDDEEGEGALASRDDEAWFAAAQTRVMRRSCALEQPLDANVHAPTPPALCRGAVSCSWNGTEGNRGKIAVAFCATHPAAVASSATLLRAAGGCVESYVFDVGVPYVPYFTAIPPSQLAVLTFSPREANLLAGGGVDGTVSLFDMRRGAAPVVCVRAAGCAARATALCWLHATTKAMELFAVTDSPLCHTWDLRRPGSLPCDVVRLAMRRSSGTGAPGSEEPLHGTCADYVASSVGPGRMLVGTDGGVALALSRRGRSEGDRTHMVHSGHFGPVTAVARHPAVPKLFLTAGDWRVSFWHEDRRRPLFSTSCRRATVADAVWHPQHPALMFLVLADGTVELWDVTRSLSAPQDVLQVSGGGGGGGSSSMAMTLRCSPDGDALVIGFREGGAVVVAVSAPSLALCVEAPAVARAVLQRMVDRLHARSGMPHHASGADDRHPGITDVPAPTFIPRDVAGFTHADPERLDRLRKDVTEALVAVLPPPIAEGSASHGPHHRDDSHDGSAASAGVEQQGGAAPRASRGLHTPTPPKCHTHPHRPLPPQQPDAERHGEEGEGDGDARESPPPPQRQTTAARLPVQP